MKRKASNESRSAKRTSAAISGARRTQPTARSAPRATAKPKVSQRASQPRAARTRGKAARDGGTKPSSAPLDPRIAAVIALALHDEALAAARAEELARPASGWTALARARGVQRR